MTDASSDTSGTGTRGYESLVAQVSEVVASVTGRKISDPDANLSSEGVDSLALLDVLALLEKRFGVELTENVLSEFVSISRMIRVVKDAMRDASAG